jgi:hypothetical protein
MNRRLTPFAATSLTAAALMAAALLWAVRLTSGQSPWEDSSATVMAVGMVVVAAVSVVALLVAGARWGHRLGAGLVAATLALAVVLPADRWWWAALVASLLSLFGLLAPQVTGPLARRPPAPLPLPAVLLPLVLIIAPPLVASASLAGVEHWGWVPLAGMPLLAVWYVRAAPLATVATRVGVPFLTVVGLAGLPAPGRVVLLTAGGLATALAWTRAARLAARPLLQRGRPVPILPELVPPEVLDAAGLDEKGRRHR